MTDSYDDLPYRSRAFAMTWPPFMGTLARLFGLSPAAPETARVLELGCSSGGNLIPMAERFPQATFIGIDRNASAIAEGQQRASDLGLANITLYVEDLAHPQDHGPIDYLIAHGVYSWVPADVQRALLALCRSHLAPHGVAYVSYNTLPGWAHRSALREMALFHAAEQPTLKDRLDQTRAIVNLVREATPEDTPLRGLMEAEHRHFSAMPDWYVAHEHLDGANEALWFHEFVGRAGDAGLQFLAEAELRDMVALDLPEPIRSQVESLGTDQLRLEQYLDFVRHRTFRRSLLVHQEAVIDRNIALSRVDGLHVAGSLASRPSDDLVQSVLPAEGPTDPITEATWRHIEAALPGSVPVDTLVQQVADDMNQSADDVHDTVANALFAALMHATVQLSLSALPAARASASPIVWSIARDEVARGESWVTNRRHQGVQLDPYMTTLVPLLDGTCDRDRAVQVLADAALDGTFDLLDNESVPVLTRDRAVVVLTEGWSRAVDVLAYYALLI